MRLTDEQGQLPWPAQQQAEVGGQDWQLTAAARATNPQVGWWWNQRQTAEGWGALCYCCGELIAQWSRLHAMPREAKEAVDAHRRAELDRLADRLMAEGQAAARRLEARARAIASQRRRTPPH